MNKNKGLGKSKERSLDLVEWYIRFALASTAISWSMEQVAAPEVIKVVERLRLEHRGQFSYAIIPFKKLGVPQNRKRLIAGSVHLVAKLLRHVQHPTFKSVRSVISKPRGTYLRGNNAYRRETQRVVVGEDGKERYKYDRAKWTDYCFPIDGVAPTVLRTALVWITGNGEGCNRSVLWPSELAALQTFPPTYKWPNGKNNAYYQIANAVPPRVAELMLRKPRMRHMDLGEGLRCGSPSLR